MIIGIYLVLIFFPIRFQDECLVSQKKASLFFFLPTANAFAVVQFSNPSTKFFLLHFHFLSSDLLCLVSSVRRYQHYFCSNYPYHTISIYYRKLQKEKDKIFCYRKKCKQNKFQYQYTRILFYKHLFKMRPSPGIFWLDGRCLKLVLRFTKKQGRCYIFSLKCINIEAKLRFF